MIRLPIGQIAEITGAGLDRVPDREAVVTGPVVIDSRQAVPGSLFAALPGERADGHDFAAAAAPAGAVVMLGSRPAGVPALLVADVPAAIAVIIIGDAYNASPEEMAAALAALGVMASGRRAYAVLGRMAELGERSRDFHEQAGVIAARTGLAGLIAVCEAAASILDGAKAAGGFAGELLAVPDGGAAVAALGERLRPGDVVLVKASRAAGLQTVALALAAER